MLPNLGRFVVKPKRLEYIREALKRPSIIPNGEAKRERLRTKVNEYLARLEKRNLQISADRAASQE